MLDHDYQTTTIEDAAEFARRYAEPDYGYADGADPFAYRRTVDPAIEAELDALFTPSPCSTCSGTGCTSCIPF